MILRLLILVSFTLPVYSQDLLEVVDSLLIEREFEEAINILNNTIHDEKEIKQRLIYEDKLATIYGKTSEYEKAFQLKDKVIAGFKNLENDTLTSRALYGLCKLFNDRFDYESGFPYLKEALEYSRTKKDSARIISNMGVYYRNINQPDSARYFYQRGIDLYPEEEGLEFFVISYNNLAILEKSLKRYDEALAYYDKAISLALRKGDEVQAASLEVNKTYIYYDLKEFKKAEDILNENEQVIMSKGVTLDKLNFDLIRYNIAEKLGKTSETLHFYKRYRKTKDSVDNLKLNTQIAEFEVKYETAEKEKEIAIKESQLAKAEVQKQYLWGGLIAALWFGLFGTLFYWSRNRYQRKLNEERMHNLAISAMLSGQENERLRIAKDLHDSLGGLLTTIKLHFENAQSKIAEWATESNSSHVSTLLDKASKEVRRISHNMAPRALNLSGLNSALADLCTEINATGSIRVSYEWNGGELPEQDRIMVYRIVEEACNNVLKHAKAQNLFIQVNVFEDGYSIQVEDDGRGFEMNKHQGMGLRNMRSRASILKAEFQIDSSPESGTSILMTKDGVPTPS